MHSKRSSFIFFCQKSRWYSPHSTPFPFRYSLPFHVHKLWSLPGVAEKKDQGMRYTRRTRRTRHGTVAERIETVECHCYEYWYVRCRCLLPTNFLLKSLNWGEAKCPNILLVLSLPMSLLSTYTVPWCIGLEPALAIPPYNRSNGCVVFARSPPSPIKAKVDGNPLPEVPFGNVRVHRGRNSRQIKQAKEKCKTRCLRQGNIVKTGIEQ